MNKHPERTAARRTEIITAARDLFFEYGYDATSIRMIQERVGKQVAVFYYYFESKDQVFDCAIDMTLEPYEERLRNLATTGLTNPIDDLNRILTFVEDHSRAFHAQYSNTLHWSVVSGIHARMLQLIRKYLTQLLGNYAANGEVAFSVMPLEETCGVLAYAIGASAFLLDSGTYSRQRQELHKLIPALIKVYQK